MVSRICKSKKFKVLVVFIPTIIIILITLISNVIFERNRDQTYESLKIAKEYEVRRLVKEMDEVLDYSSKESLNDEQKFLVKVAIREITRQDEVFCYLLDKDFNLASEYNEINPELEINKKILNRINSSEEFKNSAKGIHTNHYIPLSVEGIDDFEFYCQEIPTDNTEYYVIVGVSKKLIDVNPAMNTCKIFIASLNILLSFSIFGNLFLIERIQKENR